VPPQRCQSPPAPQDSRPTEPTPMAAEWKTAVARLNAAVIACGSSISAREISQPSAARAPRMCPRNATKFRTLLGTGTGANFLISLRADLFATNVFNERRTQVCSRFARATSRLRKSQKLVVWRRKRWEGVAGERLEAPSPDGPYTQRFHNRPLHELRLVRNSLMLARRLYFA